MRNSKVRSCKKIVIFFLSAILIACSVALVFTGIGARSYPSGGHKATYTAQDIVNLNGDPESGTTYVVSDAAGLEKLESLVNGGKNFSGIIVRMSADINMSGRTFRGIGSFSAGNAFAGTFDGNGYTISNLTINDTSGGSLPASLGLFGYTSSASVINVTLTEMRITMSSSATAIPSGIGGVVGKMTGGSIENCSVSGNFSTGGASAYTGGIVGLTGEGVGSAIPVITDCTSNVLITGFGTVGGIVGGAVGGISVEGCINTGKLTCENIVSSTSIANCTAGGIIGGVVQNGTRVSVEKSRNNGTMSIYRAYAVGGIVGSVASTATGKVDITESVNQAKITANYGGGTDGCEFVGGIAGSVSGGIVTIRESGNIDSQDAITGSSAAYSIVSAAKYSGGIVGYAAGSSVLMEECYNRVSVTGSGSGTSEAIGGLIGKGTSVTLKNSYNRGSVTTDKQVSGVGGLAGQLSGGRVINSYNAGTITIRNAIASAGGIVGISLQSDAEIVNATNYGAISVESTGSVSVGIGGIAGSVEGGTVYNCFNGESISSTAAGTVQIGGLLAAGTATVKNSFAINTQVLFSNGANVTQENCERFDSNGKLLNNIGNAASLTDALNTWISTNNTVYAGALIERKTITIESSSTKFPMYGEKVGEHAITYESDYLNFLTEVNNGNHFSGIKIYLMQDITLTQTGGMPPIGSDIDYFGGTFDGNGHKLTLTSIASNSLDSSANTGLFAYVKNGTIKDLTVTTVSDNAITSKNGYVGGIAGTIENSEISGVSFLGKITYSKGSVGGIVGKAIGGSITGCYANVTFSSGEDSARVGGILGESLPFAGVDTQVSYCYSLSDIERGLAVAGIYAGDLESIQIDNCYSVGKLVGAYSAAGIGKGNVTAGYYLTGKITAPTVTGGGIELTYAQMSDDCAGLEGFVFGRKGLYGGWYVYAERGYGYLPQLTNFAVLGGGGQKTDSLSGISKYKALIQYRIELDLDGGSTQGDVPETYTINSGQIDILAATRGGYKFLGWSGTGISGMVDSITIAANSIGHVSYAANWELVTYTVKYGNLTDEEIASLNNPTEYSAETTSVELKYPERDYYEFAGWRDTVKDVLYPTVTLPMTDNFGDKEFNAEFKPIEYKITYSNMGEGKLPPNAPTTYTVESSIAVQGEPMRDGYVFKGWQVSGEQDLQRIILIQKGTHGDRVYTAVWQIVEYTIRYEGINAGEINGTNPVTYSIETPEFTLVNPVRRGYDFKGWQEMNGGSAETTVTIRPGEKYGNIVFTATWQPAVYRIVYNLYDGAYEGGNSNPATYTVLDHFTLINPYKAGYTFVGWMLGGDSSPNKTYTISNSVGALEFSAIYEKNYTTLDHKSADGKTSLVKVEREDGFDIYSVFKVTELDVTTLPATVGDRIGKNNEVKNVYRLYFEERAQTAKTAYGNSLYGFVPLADSTLPEIKVSIYGAVKNGMLMQLAEDGSITPIQAQVSGSYYIFNSTEALGTFLVVAPTSLVQRAFEGINLWITVGIIGGVVLIAGILLLLKFTLLRKYTITFKGARIKPLKLKKGRAITLPAAYEWYNDPECKVRFALKAMPKRNIRLYTNTSKEDSEYRTAPALRQKYAGGGQPVRALPAGSYQANQNAMSGRMNAYNMQAAAPYQGGNTNGQYVDWQRQQQLAQEAAQNVSAPISTEERQPTDNADAAGETQAKIGGMEKTENLAEAVRATQNQDNKVGSLQLQKTPEKPIDTLLANPSKNWLNELLGGAGGKEEIKECAAEETVKSEASTAPHSAEASEKTDMQEAASRTVKDSADATLREILETQARKSENETALKNSGEPDITLGKIEAKPAETTGGENPDRFDAEMLRTANIRQNIPARESREHDYEQARQEKRRREYDAYGSRETGVASERGGDANRSRYAGRPKRREAAEPAMRKKAEPTFKRKRVVLQEDTRKAMRPVIRRYAQARPAVYDVQPPKVRRKKPVPRYTAVTANVLEKRREARRKGYYYDRYDDYIQVKPRKNQEQQSLEALRTQWELHLLQENADIRRSIEEERQRMKAIEKVAQRKQYESLIAAREGLTLDEMNALLKRREGGNGKSKRRKPTQKSHAQRAESSLSNVSQKRATAKTSAADIDLDGLSTVSDPDGYLDGLNYASEATKLHHDELKGLYDGHTERTEQDLRPNKPKRGK